MDKIEIDREEELVVDKRELPTDAQFKEYEPVVVQDIQIKTDNVRFWKEKYYAPSTGKSYLASLPTGYEGEFGPGLRSLVITLYYASGMTEPKIIGKAIVPGREPSAVASRKARQLIRRKPQT